MLQNGFSSRRSRSVSKDRSRCFRLFWEKKKTPQNLKKYSSLSSENLLISVSCFSSIEFTKLMSTCPMRRFCMKQLAEWQLKMLNGRIDQFFSECTMKIQSIGTVRSEQTVKTQIRLLLNILDVPIFRTFILHMYAPILRVIFYISFSLLY